MAKYCSTVSSSFKFTSYTNIDLTMIPECLINDDCDIDKFCDVAEKVCKDPCLFLQDGEYLVLHCVINRPSPTSMIFSVRSEGPLQGENSQATVLLPQRTRRQPSL